MPLYKITYDKRVKYIAGHALVHISNEGRCSARHISATERTYLIQLESCIGTIKKVEEPERKMFWLAFGPTLRAMGVIK